MIRFVAAIVLCLALSGCYRTRYVNLHPADAPPPATSTPEERRSSGGWRNFWLYGWFPNQLVDAGARCGGSEHVATIETRQSFFQGLIATFASYYIIINIYSPWTGRVTCDHGGSSP